MMSRALCARRLARLVFLRPALPPAAGVKLSPLACAIHPGPTLAEISKRAAGSCFSEKPFGDRTRGPLRLFLALKGRACMQPGKG